MSRADETWSDNENDLLKHLVKCDLSASEIADAMSFAGLTVRGENAVQARAARLGLRFSARSSGRDQRNYVGTRRA